MTFEEPLRTRRGLRPRGSNLHEPASLRQLLTWPRSPMQPKQPDLAVILIDEDGEGARRRNKLRRALEDPPLGVRVAIGMARREFESWLIADGGTVSRVLGVTAAPVGKPEVMKPREAKERFAGLIGSSDRSDENAIRCEIAATLDFESTARKCASLAQFRAELIDQLA